MSAGRKDIGALGYAQAVIERWGLDIVKTVLLVALSTLFLTCATDEPSARTVYVMAVNNDGTALVRNTSTGRGQPIETIRLVDANTLAEVRRLRQLYLSRVVTLHFPQGSLGGQMCHVSCTPVLILVR